MRIALLAQCITEHCIAVRGNQRYLSPAGRKKVLNLAAYLAALGHDVEIVSSSYAKGRFPELVERIGERITIHHGPTWALGKLTPMRRWLATRHAQRWLVQQRSRIDLAMVYNYDPERALPVLWAQRRHALPFVLDYEDGFYLARHYNGPLYRAIERAIYRHCSAVIAVNEGLLERIAALGFEPPAQVIHGYFNDADISRLAASPGATKEILFSGNFSRGFGFDELRRYIDCCPEGWLLNICGRGGKEETEIVRGWCENHPRARFHGFVSDTELDAMRRRAAAVLLLNATDSAFNRSNFPSKLFDYLSAGKLIVCTANPLLADYAGLDCVVQLESIEAEFPHIAEQLAQRRFVANQVAALHASMLERLSRVLEAAVPRVRVAAAPRLPS